VEVNLTILLPPKVTWSKRQIWKPAINQLTYKFEMQETPYSNNLVEYSCTSSIGVVVFIGHEHSAKEILQIADRAMYQAKEGGGNQIRFNEAVV
jgi:diguanylate cyclase (GGDEF)-like protein